MAKSTIIQVKNKTGSAIAAGKAVYISGFDEISHLPTIALADCATEAKMPSIGLVQETIQNNATGVVRTLGLIAGFDTADYSANTPVFVGRTGAIQFYDPAIANNGYFIQQLGVVARSADAPHGQIDLLPLEIKTRTKHIELVDVFTDQHHTENHAKSHVPRGSDPFKHAIQHHKAGGDEINHNSLAGVNSDSHKQYVLVDGTRAFTGSVSGIDPTISTHLATKSYVDQTLSGDGYFNKPAVLSVYNSGPPVAPSLGDRYIIGSAPSGTWTGGTEKIATWGGSEWTIETPYPGWTLWNIALGGLYTYTDIWPAGVWQVHAVGVPAGVIGSVQYNDSGVFNGSANLFWDEANNRLGIGTSSPTSTLSVNGHLGITEGVAPTFTAGVGKLYTKTADKKLYFLSSTGTEYDLTLGSSGVTGTSSVGRVAYWNNTTSITGDNELYWDYANNYLGIGTSTPSKALDVIGQANIVSGTFPSLGLERTTTTTTVTAAPLRLLSTSSGDMVDGFGTQITAAIRDSAAVINEIGAIGFIRDGADNSGAITFKTSFAGVGLTERIRISGAGYLGIGTAVTNERITIDGNVSFKNQTVSATPTTNYGKLYAKSDNALYYMSGVGTEYDLTQVNSAALGVGQAGYVTYWNGVRTVTGESFLFWNESTNRLGVGTATPNERITVEGILSLKEQASAPTLSSGYGKVYSKTGGDLYFLSSAGAEHNLIVSADYVNNSTFEENKNFWNTSIAYLNIATDGYASKITEAEHYRQLSAAIESITKDLDGYATENVLSGLDQTVSEHYTQHGKDIKAITDVLDGYLTPTIDLSGYETKAAHGLDIKAIIDVVDGYALDVDLNGLNQTEAEHYRQHSAAIESITKDLDGYASKITEAEHYTQHSAAINDIISSLDAYGVGAGDITGAGDSGQVTYWTAEKVIAGSDNLTFNATNGYLGVGTTTPNERLTVNGAVSIAPAVIDPVQDLTYGKVYVSADGTKIMFVNVEGTRHDLTKYDIDGGNFADTYVNTNNFDGGTFED